jgi:hypothetical protein
MNKPDSGNPLHTVAKVGHSIVERIAAMGHILTPKGKGSQASFNEL